MYFYKIYLRGTNDIFTWQSEKKIETGALVKIQFRKRNKIGLVVERNSEKPDFKTLEILEVLNTNFIQKEYFKIAKEIAEENFAKFMKIMDLIIPKTFLNKNNPVNYEKFYTLKNDEKVRGEKQILAINTIKSNDGKISEKIFRQKIPLSTIKNLLEKKIIEQENGSILPINLYQAKSLENHNLTKLQKQIFDDISATEKPSLLWGVTGSGKTEIYKKLAQKLAKNEGQILFLVPEISLIEQLFSEFSAIFTGEVSVWHSKLTENEKVQEFARINSGQSKILIGTRSACFIPFKNLKLAIMDEEHEWTYKNDFSPRYWTHSVLQKIREKLSIKLVFGTATPRLESFKNCEENLWKIHKLTKKVHQEIPPKIEIINMQNEIKKRNFSPFSEKMLEALNKIIEQKKQAILFINKRGYAGSTMCKKCGLYFECPNCEANMKFHCSENHSGKLVCHLCGYMELFPTKCPECQETNFVFRGWGTQQIEKVIKEEIPTARVLRADADTVKGKYDFSRIFNAFHNHEADILLGTQMISKGLDFPKVVLAGIILADVGLGLPDFRAEERVFSMLNQVAGRAGRRNEQGQILVQTFHEDLSLFSYLKKHDLEGFYHQEMKNRQENNFPPFKKIAKITFANHSKKIAFDFAKKFYELVKKNEEKSKIFRTNLAPAFFPKLRGKYYFNVFLRTKNLSDLQQFMNSIPIPPEAKIDIEPATLL